MKQELSEYEKQRQANIARNQQLLQELRVPNLIDRSQSPKKKLVKQHVPKKVKKEIAQPTRVSARLRGIAADNEDHIKRQARDQSAEAPSNKARKIEKLDQSDEKEFLALLNTVRKIPNTEPVKREMTNQKASTCELSKLTSTLSIKHIWATVKVTQERINCSVFHPSNTKLLACAGDVSGYLGFWDVEGSKEADEAGEADPVVYMYRPHTRTITDLKFNPANPSKLFTSSYDGVLQCFDMEHASFEAVSMGLESFPFTNFDITNDGRTIWFSTSDGELCMKDFRSRADPSIFQLRDKKIGCIDLHPTDQNLIALASNDRTATIWDSRMLTGNKAAHYEPVHEFEHGYSVTSAYWSPLGNKLATTSYDDYIRIFDMQSPNEMTLQSAIKHNNHTGKWVTNFRARWNKSSATAALDHQHFVIGSMKHPLEIYSGENGEEIATLYDGDHITAVPAVAQFHPTTPTITLLAGNGSGRMVCWN
ncbi:WD40-repeat-containing domain protein [Radiomyces spectabilis]|uniref:WD40-repeat-containing domain protein n=1 Tax=Radiomyces spectabilis TaxID=64574 RepID=UPI00221F0A18|nr:WD40-repeat-containing domain protein [Radiomyces spectabilis]KAI8391130.1 WD40-repeat-containing domain protein [Radiomyces spectabilis]